MQKLRMLQEEIDTIGDFNVSFLVLTGQQTKNKDANQREVEVNGKCFKNWQNKNSSYLKMSIKLNNPLKNLIKEAREMVSYLINGITIPQEDGIGTPASHHLLHWDTSYHMGTVCLVWVSNLIAIT